MNRTLVIVDDFPPRKADTPDMREVVLAFAISPDGQTIQLYPRPRKALEKEDYLESKAARHWMERFRSQGWRVKRLTVREFRDDD